MTTRNQAQTRGYSFFSQLFFVFIKLGLDAAVKNKMETKYDKGLEKEIIDWIHAETGETINDFLPDLKSGVILCKFIISIFYYSYVIKQTSLMNKFYPNSIPRISKMASPFKQLVSF